MGIWNDEIVTTNVGKMWVFDKATSSFEKKELLMVEHLGVDYWYEDAVTKKTAYDPFHVDRFKVKLRRRVLTDIKKKLAEAKATVEELEKDLNAVSNG